MYLTKRAATRVLLVVALAAAAPAQEWTEAVVAQKFLEQSPQAREARARVAIAEAERRSRTLYANPSFNYSREGAGRTEFFQAGQALPLTGRLNFLRQAGAAMVRATEADGAFSLWQARSSLRQAFYRALTAEQSARIYSAGITEIECVIRVLAEREREGEGSKFDRLRTDRERAEMLAELALARAAAAVERSQLLAFLPEGIEVTAVSGEMEPPPIALDAVQLTRRALAIREDYGAEQRRLEQYGSSSEPPNASVSPSPMSMPA